MPLSDSGRSCPAATRPGSRAIGSAETGRLELAVDALGQLVETLVHRHLARDHTLERCRPLGREVEEKRLGREVDLRAGRRGLVLLEIARIALRDPVAERLVVPDRLADRVDEVHLARAEQ